MSRRRPKGLSTQERELWTQVTSQISPLQGRVKPLVAEPPKHERGSGSVDRPVPAIAPKQEFYIGARVRPTKAISVRLQGAGTGAALDGHINARLKRGKIKPEARIDLHGMTLAEAHPALIRFVQQAHGAQKRLVLVITGKGKPRDQGEVRPLSRGILRQQVPHWLLSGALAPLVLHFGPANIRHGGDGALYVYLRRNKV